MEIFDFTSEIEINETTKFFFLIGTEEEETAVPNLTKMIALLKEKGVTVENIANRIIEGGKHNEGLWSQYFPEAHKWLCAEK